MRKYWFVAALLLAFGTPAFAQTEAVPQGTARYEVRVRLSPGLIELPPEMEEFRAQLETTQVMHQRVEFYGPTALGTLELPPMPSLSEGIVPIGMGRPASTFWDVDGEVSVQQLDLLGRTFLIEEPFAVRAWRLTGETDTFLGHEVHKAVAAGEGETVEAWFAPGIPAPVGPVGYGGLPGLILVVEQTGPMGRTTIAAQALDLAPLAAPPAAPTEGRRVSREEFNRTLAERMEAMQRMLPGMMRDGTAPTPP